MKFMCVKTFFGGRFIKISKILYKIIEIKTKENAV